MPLDIIADELQRHEHGHWVEDNPPANIAQEIRQEWQEWKIMILEAFGGAAATGAIAYFRSVTLRNAARTYLRNILAEFARLRTNWSRDRVLDAIANRIVLSWRDFGRFLINRYRRGTLADWIASATRQVGEGLGTYVRLVYERALRLTGMDSASRLSRWTAALNRRVAEFDRAAEALRRVPSIVTPETQEFPSVAEILARRIVSAPNINPLTPEERQLNAIGQNLAREGVEDYGEILFELGQLEDWTIPLEASELPVSEAAYLAREAALARGATEVVTAHEARLIASSIPGRIGNTISGLSRRLIVPTRNQIIRFARYLSSFRAARAVLGGVVTAARVLPYIGYALLAYDAYVRFRERNFDIRQIPNVVSDLTIDFVTGTYDLVRLATLNYLPDYLWWLRQAPDEQLYLSQIGVALPRGPGMSGYNPTDRPENYPGELSRAGYTAYVLTDGNNIFSDLFRAAPDYIRARNNLYDLYPSLQNHIPQMVRIRNEIRDIASWIRDIYSGGVITGVRGLSTGRSREDELSFQQGRLQEKMRELEAQLEACADIGDGIPKLPEYVFNPSELASRQGEERSINSLPPSPMSNSNPAARGEETKPDLTVQNTNNSLPPAPARVNLIEGMRPQNSGGLPPQPGDRTGIQHHHR